LDTALSQGCSESNQKDLFLFDAFNPAKYFEVIKCSPGLEEYALILAFKKIRQKFSHLDYLVFDVLPTTL